MSCCCCGSILVSNRRAAGSNPFNNKYVWIRWVEWKYLGMVRTWQQRHRLFMSSETGYQYYCSHIATKNTIKSCNKHIIVIMCKRTLGENQLTIPNDRICHQQKRLHLCCTFRFLTNQTEIGTIDISGSSTWKQKNQQQNITSSEHCTGDLGH